MLAALEAQLEGTGGSEDSSESFLEETPGLGPKDGESWEEEDSLEGRASWVEVARGSGPMRSA